MTRKKDEHDVLPRTGSRIHEPEQLPTETTYQYCDRLERALRDYEDRFEGVMDGAACGIWDWDRHTDKVFVSDSFFKLLGFESPRQRLRLRGLFELIHPEDLIQIRNNLKQYLRAGKRFSFDCRFESFGGEYIWMNLSGLAVRDKQGRIKRISGSLIDIDLRVAAFQAQLDSETRFHEAFANSSTGLAIISLEGHYLFANRSFCKLLDRQSSEIVGKSVLEFTYSEDRALTMEMASSLVYEHSRDSGFEKRYIRKDGSIAWARVTSVIHRDQDGMPKYYISLITDLSEQKKIESENQRLEAALRRLQALSTIGTMTSGLAHDLNKLLTPIIGYLDMTLEDLPKESTVRENLEIALESAQHAKDVAIQILNISKKETDGLQMIKLSTIVDNSIKLLRVSLPVGISVERAFETERDVIGADYHQIHQILMNLGVNAGHAMKETGGVLRIRISETEVHLDSFGPNGTRRGQYVRLEISDTGKGMSPETQARIFEPFFTTKDNEEGTGLGLFVVKGIVRRHGGSIHVKSEPGCGTTFTILFPRSTAEAHVSTENHVLDVKGGEHILWVDDEPLILELGKQMLEYLGYRVSVADCSHSALKLFKESSHDIDLIITDSSIPDLSGEDLALQIHEIRGDIPVILCSGFSAQASNIGQYSAILDKPFSIKELARAVRHSLNMNRQTVQVPSSIAI